MNVYDLWRHDKTPTDQAVLSMYWLELNGYLPVPVNSASSFHTCQLHATVRFRDTQTRSWF